MAKEPLQRDVCRSEAPGGVDSSRDKADRRWNARSDVGVLVVICALFLALRVPLMYRQPGGTDEGDFSVPGYTILREGVPRIPYVPARDAKGFFYRADEVLLLLPPLYYCWQAGFYIFFGPSYGTARLASGAAAVLAILLVYIIARQLTKSRTAALWSAGLYSLSRLCFFPGMAARPDMLCGTIGLAAVGAFLQWRDTGRPRWLVATSVLIGLGGLTHPYAIVYAAQLGVWSVLVAGRLLQRGGRFLLLAGGAVAVFSLWLLLIVPHFDIFRIQFFNNVLNRSGPGIVERLTSPWEAIGWQRHMIVEHAGPVQTALTFGALGVVTVLALRSRDRMALALAVGTCSSVGMLMLFAGIHPTKGYWCYPGAWLFVCVGWCVVQAGRALGRFCAGRSFPAFYCRMATAIGSACLVLLMMPGSGIKAWLTHVHHWRDPAYDAQRFVQVLLEDVPRGSRVVVDAAYVLPFFVDERCVLLAGSELVAPHDYLPYDYYVAGRESIESGFCRDLGGRFVRSYGEKDNVLECYAELYTSGGTAGGQQASENRPPTDETDYLP
ncbi:MAG: ArnT family glycosyltransferase [Thermoguttaceae bacterium]